MSTSRPFAYNTGSTIPGTIQIGNLAIGTPTSGFTSTGLQWWNGPDEELGYVIAQSVPEGNQPTPFTGVTAYVGFFRTDGNNESSFIDLTERISINQSFETGDSAYIWLNDNGYWSSWNYNNDGFNYINFSSTTSLTQVSTIGVISNLLYLTNTSAADVGNVYRSNSIRYDRDFNLEWSFQCGGGSGADGFCLQWTTTNNSNGSAGGSVGYVANSSTINALQFKTYTNNNITWLKNNVSQGSTSVSSGFFRQVVYFWLDYDHSNSIGYLYYSTSTTKPGSPNRTLTGFSFDNSNYYIGFGAATGGSTDNHILRSWKLTFI